MKISRWADAISRNFFRSVLFLMSAIGFGAVMEVQALDKPQALPMTEDDGAAKEAVEGQKKSESETVACYPCPVAGVRG